MAENISLKDPAVVFSFIVDNSEKWVREQLAARGILVEKKDNVGVKNLLVDLYNSKADLSWLKGWRFNPYAGNYTTQFKNSAQGGATEKGIFSGITWEDGLGAIGVALATLLGGNQAGLIQENTSSANTEMILGMQKTVFYGLAAIMVVIIILVAYLALRKK